MSTQSLLVSALLVTSATGVADETGLMQARKAGAVHLKELNTDLAGLRNSTLQLLREGGTPAVVSFADSTMVSIEGSVEQAIKDDHDADQTLINTAFAVFGTIAKKFEDATNTLGDMREEQKKASADHLACRALQKPLCEAHDQCRAEQAVLQKHFDEAEGKYQGAADKVEQCGVTSPGSLPMDEQEQNQKDFVDKGKVYFEIHHKLVAKKAECDEREQKLTTQTLKCDALKEQLEAAACASHDHDHVSYTIMVSEWEIARDAYSDARTAVTAASLDRRKEHRSLSDVKCILAAIKERGGRPCTDKDEPGVADSVIAKCSEEASDTSHLNVDMPDEPEQPERPDAEAHPCTSEFLEQEYGTLTGDCFSKMPACKPCNGDGLMTFPTLCIHANGDKPALMSIPEDVCVSKIEFKYKKTPQCEGSKCKVSCRRAASGQSNWGCDQDSIGVVIADGSEVVAPVFDITEGLSPHFHSHAHWYRLDGVDKNSESMEWTFKKPIQFPAKDYHLWYNEDLTGGTESDNSGSACYDVTFHKAESCDELAPMQFHKVCVGAAGDKPGQIELPEGTCVTEIDHYWTTGSVQCSKNSGTASHFGCGDMEALVWSQGSGKDVLLPLAANTEGVTRTSHKHAHWYHMEGVSANSRLLEMKLKEEFSPMPFAGKMSLWYNEDLTGGTEGDNSGTACYDVAVHRSKKCNKVFHDVCIHASGDKPAPLLFKRDMCVAKIEFTHKSNPECADSKCKVSCRTAATGDSNWGCDANSIGLVIADGQDVVAPVFDVTEGLTPHFSGHAHWYRLDGVSQDSETMLWEFKEPMILPAKEYKLWYNEDLTGGTERDNRGSACYDVEVHEADSCSHLAPLQFHKVCTSARGDKPGTITLPADTCVTEIDVYWVSGSVSCNGKPGNSHFGCGDLEGLVWTAAGSKTLLMPLPSNTVGVTKLGHKHAHWYQMEGVTRNSRLLEMKIKPEVQALKLSGDLNLWYNEDLTGGTEGDNAGTACYEVAVHRAETCK